MNTFHLGRHHDRIHALTLAIIVGVVGYSLSHLSHAATTYNHNAIGYVNSCSLDSFGQTVIYGWAYDADTGNNAFPKVNLHVGPYSATVYTDQSGYNEGKINAYLRSNRPGTPITGTYGFRWTIGGVQLTKGVAYGVSGTTVNEGPGGATNLDIDVAGNAPDGINAAYQLNPSRTLPDACLGYTTPAPPPDPDMRVCDLSTKQVVTIKQSTYNANPGRYTTDTSKCSTPPVPPPPAGGGGGGSGGTGGSGGSKPPASSGSHSNSTASAIPDAVNTGKADATVKAGTLSAVVSVPSNSAKTVQLYYGDTEAGLDATSDEVAVTGDKVEVSLSELQPKKKYYYQISRTDSAGNNTTSPTASFDTAGYAISLHFVDADDKAVAGIEGVLDDADSSRGKSDKNGDIKFYDLDVGTYTVVYEYQKLTYGTQFDTDSVSSDQASSGKVVELKDTVNVSTLKDGSTTPLPAKKHGAVFKILLLLLIILAIGGAAVWFLLRRRRMNMEALYGTYDTAGSGVIDLPTSQVETIIPSRSTPPPASVSPAPTLTAANGQPLEHVGESLKEMVIRSMHDEAQKRKGPGGPDKT